MFAVTGFQSDLEEGGQKQKFSKKILKCPEKKKKFLTPHHPHHLPEGQSLEKSWNKKNFLKKEKKVVKSLPVDRLKGDLL